MFAVSPCRQGAGIGRALIARAAGVASAWGSVRMEMTVIAQRADLLAWYRRLGFEPTGETRPFPYGDERFGRPRRADLHFVVLAAPLDRLTSLPGAREGPAPRG
jgi:GNAT superfamily N-acetyltransferase